MKRALLFDIDGTLILTGGAGARALDRAFKYLYGLDYVMEKIHPHGKTDPEIVREIFNRSLGRDPSSAEMERALNFYVYFLKFEVQYALKFRVLPGVKELLDRLQNYDEFIEGLATGNVRNGARVKLSRPGLWQYFKFGGFGTDSENRKEILISAIERARRLSGNSVKGLIIGDTPRDVYAAHQAGLPVLAVATSTYTIDELKKAGADFTLPDLSNIDEVFEVLRSY